MNILYTFLHLSLKVEEVEGKVQPCFAARKQNRKERLLAVIRRLNMMFCRVNVLMFTVLKVAEKVSSLANSI